MQDGQTRWQCRRGLLELELLLLKFFDTQYPSLSSQQKISFMQLLQESDPTLQHWLLGQGMPESSEWQALIHCIRQTQL